MLASATRVRKLLLGVSAAEQEFAVVAEAERVVGLEVAEVEGKKRRVDEAGGHQAVERRLDAAGLGKGKEREKKEREPVKANAASKGFMNNACQEKRMPCQTPKTNHLPLSRSSTEAPRREQSPPPLQNKPRKTYLVGEVADRKGVEAQAEDAVEPLQGAELVKTAKARRVRYLRPTKKEAEMQRMDKAVRGKNTKGNLRRGTWAVRVRNGKELQGARVCVWEAGFTPLQRFAPPAPGRPR